MTELTAKLHRPFEITLGSQALSGYEWKPVFNHLALKFLGKRREANMRRMGAAGGEIFRFEALRSGDHDISFELIRPFESTSVERRDFSLHVD
jgi:predicted secreted protein